MANPINTTRPPTKRERLTIQEFEAIISAQGEAQARLRNLQAQQVAR